jgi:hypothetical protein
MQDGLLPESVKLREAIVGGIPGEDGSSDSPDRGACDPAWPNPLVMQVMVRAGEIRPKRIPAAEHEGDVGLPVENGRPAGDAFLNLAQAGNGPDLRCGVTRHENRRSPRT